MSHASTLTLTGTAVVLEIRMGQTDKQMDAQTDYRNTYAHAPHAPRVKHKLKHKWLLDTQA